MRGIYYEGHIQRGEYTMKIAICDDEKELLLKLGKIIEDEFKIFRDELIIDYYETGEEFLKGYDENEYDVAFLDVYLPGISGFDVAQIINKRRNNTYIIFITSNAELVYDCFDYKPFYFIRKDEYLVGVRKVIKKLSVVMKQNEVLEVDINGVNKKIVISDIIYIQSDNHSIIIHTRKYKYSVRGNMTDFEVKLIQFDFIRVHRKYIINLSHLNNIDTELNEVKLYNDTRLEMSRNYKKIVKEAQVKYERSLK